MSLIPFTPFFLPTFYFLSPAALAEITPKNVLRLIAQKIRRCRQHSIINELRPRFPTCGIKWIPPCIRDTTSYMQTLIIEVSGGVVQEVYCDAQSIRVVKVDWDAGESPGDAFDAGEIFVQSMSVLPDETREAVATV
jgi:hypothetical protein